MQRLVLFLAPLALLGCASVQTSALVVDEGPVARSSAATPVLQPMGEFYAKPSAPAPEPVATTTPSIIVAEPSLYEPSPALEGDESLHASRFTLKGGYYGADEDTLDDGYIFNASWMRFFTRFFALEFEAGYMDADGDESTPLGNVDVEVWSVPLFVNGRLNAPLWILDVYGGAGVGGFYYDAEASALGVSADDDGFLLGGNVFLGGTVNLADRIALGLEAKYYASEDIDDVDEGLNGYALMLTLGWSR